MDKEDSVDMNKKNTSEFNVHFANRVGWATVPSLNMTMLHHSTTDPCMNRKAANAKIACG
jgi:hypothetical protein